MAGYASGRIFKGFDYFFAGTSGWQFIAPWLRWTATWGTILTGLGFTASNLWLLAVDPTGITFTTMAIIKSLLPLAAGGLHALGFITGNKSGDLSSFTGAARKMLGTWPARFLSKFVDGRGAKEVLRSELAY